MTDASLLLAHAFSKRPPQLRGLEVRIVAESLGAPGRLEHHSIHFAPTEDLAPPVHVGRDTHVPGAAVRHARKFSDEPSVVRRVERAPGQIVAGSPPLTPHPGTSPKRVNLEAGVIRNDRTPRSGPEVPRFGERVGFEGLEALDPRLVFRFGKPSLVQVYDAETRVLEDRPQLPELSGTPGGEEDFWPAGLPVSHGIAPPVDVHTRRASRWSRSSSRIPELARSSR